MGSDAVPAGLAKRTPGARAAPGLRPPALRPAARSSLMVSATHRKMDQPPKARPGTVMTPRWSAAGRMCPPIEGTAHRKVRSIRAPRGAPSLRRAPGAEGEGRPSRAFKNRGDGACLPTPGNQKSGPGGHFAGPVALSAPRGYKPARTRPPAPLEACRVHRAARKCRLFPLTDKGLRLWPPCRI